MNLLKIVKHPVFYLNYFLKRLKPFKINKNGIFFFVKYRPFWKDVQSGRWEASTFQIFDKFLDKEHSFIDIGAWLGPTVLYGCQIAKHCYAIEPDPIAFKELYKNISLNMWLREKISVFNFAIGNQRGKVKFGTKSKFGDSMSSILFGGETNSLLIDSVSLQDFFQDNKIEDCNFIKMDIEGGEVIVLPKIKDFLQKNKFTICLSLHPQLFKDVKEDSQLIVEALKIYKNIFDVSGKLLNLDVLLAALLDKKSFEVVITDKNWPI